MLFNDAEDFFTLVSSNVGKPTKLYVYSTKTDNVRSVCKREEMGFFFPFCFVFEMAANIHS